MTQTTTAPIAVQQKATGFEQAIAATVGFCTAGPLGALASWGTLKGVQGKWTPWFILGLPLAPILLGFQLGMVAVMMPELPAEAPATEQVAK